MDWSDLALVLCPDAFRDAWALTRAALAADEDAVLTVDGMDAVLTALDLPDGHPARDVLLVLAFQHAALMRQYGLGAGTLDAWQKAAGI